jgi:hypothetical protein
MGNLTESLRRHAAQTMDVACCEAVGDLVEVFADEGAHIKGVGGPDQDDQVVVVDGRHFRITWQLAEIPRPEVARDEIRNAMGTDVEEMGT